jgi:hypothetical protein
MPTSFSTANMLFVLYIMSPIHLFNMPLHSVATAKVSIKLNYGPRKLDKFMRIWFKVELTKSWRPYPDW